MNARNAAPIPVLDLAHEIAELRAELNAAFERVLDSGQFIMGPEVRAFEAEAAAFLGAKHTIGVNSGTDALVISLRALGIGAGDEVITTPFSFFASAESISNVGARPVFVDIDEATFNLDPARVEAAVTDRTKAVMPVHLYGRPCDMDAITKIAERHELKVIEDCAQSFGATHAGRRTGTLGDAGAFSFFPSKNLGAFGDAGLVATDDDAIAEHARMLRAHGAKKKYHNEILGYNSRLDSLQAALLRVKLPRVDTWNDLRREAATRYHQLLADVVGVVTPSIHDGHVFHQYTVRILHADRDTVQAKLRDHGVGTMVYYPVPQNELPVYQGQHPPCPTSDAISQQVLSLPIWPRIDQKQQRLVVEGLAAAVA